MRGNKKLPTMSKKLPTMSTEVKVALITSAATILAAIISGIFLLHGAASSSSGGGTPTPQSSPTSITTLTVPTFPSITQVINDNANVLNVTQVKNEAMKLPYSMVIYTFDDFNGTRSQFGQQTLGYVSDNPDLIAMAIDTVNKYITIASGSDIPLTKSQQSDATNAFINYFHAHTSDYTGASIAAIDSLLNAFGNI